MTGAPTRVVIQADTGGIDALLAKFEQLTKAANDMAASMHGIANGAPGGGGTPGAAGGAPPGTEHVQGMLAAMAAAWHAAYAAGAGGGAPVPVPGAGGMPGSPGMPASPIPSPSVPPLDPSTLDRRPNPSVAPLNPNDLWNPQRPAPSWAPLDPNDLWPSQNGMKPPGWLPGWAGGIGANAINFGMTGSAAGLVQSGFSIFRNPWAMAGGLIAGAGVAAATSSIGSTAGKYEGLANAMLDASPFVFSGRGIADARAYTNPDNFLQAAQLGFTPEEAARAYGEYGRVAGLGDSGLSMNQVLAAQRSRGLTAGVLGSFSSMFAAGGGASFDGGENTVIRSLSFAVGEAMQAGLKNAGLPQYLEAVHQAVSRTAHMGLRVNTDHLLFASDAIRQTDPSRFAGSIAPRVAGDFQQLGTSLTQRFLHVTPQEAMMSAMSAQLMQMAGGDPTKAMLLSEQMTENGMMAYFATDVARKTGSSFTAASALASVMPNLGASQALALSKGLGQGQLYGDGDLFERSIAQHAYSIPRAEGALRELRETGEGMDSYEASATLKDATSRFRQLMSRIGSKMLGGGNSAVQYAPKLTGASSAQWGPDAGMSQAFYDQVLKMMKFSGVNSYQLGAGGGQPAPMPIIMMPGLNQIVSPPTSGMEVW